MEEFFQIGKGDTLPSLRIQATTRINGVRVPYPGLTLATPVTFFMRQEGSGTAVLSAEPAVVEDAALAILRYDWATGDTDNGGHFDGEFKLNLGGDILTVPNDDLTGGRKIKIWITEDVA